MITIFNNPFKSKLEIKRYPSAQNDNLQGWDSADELILQHMSTLDLADKKILIINDSFGALSCALQDYAITNYTDSFVSFKATQINSLGKMSPLRDLEELSGLFDYVLLKFPKNMSFLEDILCHLTRCLKPGSQLICGYMIKHHAASSFDLLNKYIGETRTSLAQKKARLVFADFTKKEVDSPYPLKLAFESLKKELVNHSNLFSREKLDIGTRFFLENLPRGEFKTILDLGCANGIVGIMAKELNPEAKIIFSDESFMAIKSAEINYKKYFQDKAEFCWTNCYEDGVEAELNLVLCNPPFHQQTTIGDFIAWQMFTDSYRSLKKGGVIRVIGNSHLAYNVKLKKIFGNSQIVITNAKFMIVDAVKN